jgi:lipoprotein LprG
MSVTPPLSGHRRAVALALGLTMTLALGACSGEDSAEQTESLEDVLATAKATLDETSGVQIDLLTEDLPEGVDGVVAAAGIGTHAPAFEGEITVVLVGAQFDVPVISVGDTVYAKVPLTFGWSDIDPAEYGAPDPAALLSPESGFSSLLTSTEDLAKGESVRGGENNDEILTEYTGTVAGEDMANIIPSATGAFDVVYTITDDDELREMTMTGVFYPDSDPMTYAVDFTDYGVEKEIVAP